MMKGKLKTDHISWCADRFTSDGVKYALFQMHPLKAPALYGLSALFFQKHWDIVGLEVRKSVLDVLNNNKDPGMIKNTHIALNLKCKNHPSLRIFVL